MNHETMTDRSALSLRRFPAWHDTAFIEATGEVDARTAGLLSMYLREAGERSGVVVAELSGVRFFDSAGIEALVDAAVFAELTIVPSESVRRTLELAGMAARFDLRSPVDLMSLQPAGAH